MAQLSSSTSFCGSSPASTWSCFRSSPSFGAWFGLQFGWSGSCSHSRPTERGSTSQLSVRWRSSTCRWWRAGPSNQVAIGHKGLASGGAFLLFVPFQVGDLLQRLLDAGSKLVPFLAEDVDVRPSRGQLMPEPLDLCFQLLHPRIRPRGTLLGLGQFHACAHEQDFRLAFFLLEPLDQRLSRPFLLCRHSGKVRAGTRAGGGAPSRREGSAPCSRGC